MSSTIDAIYSGGVFKPIDSIVMAENQRVRLTIEPNNPQKNVAEWLEEVRAFHRQLESQHGIFPDCTEIIRADRYRDV